MSLPWRKVGMVLLACTGIGAIYMLARIRLIGPGNVGVVINYNSGKNETLGPGFHCILSPLRSFVAEVPGPQKQILTSEHLILHTADSIEARAKIDIRYQVEDAKVAATAVDGTYQAALLKATETALAGIINEESYTFQKLSSTKSLQADKVLPDCSIESIEQKRAEPRVNSLGKVAMLLLEKVNELCASWGIKIVGIQIVNMQAKDPKIEQQIEAASKTQFDANNKLLAAQIDQRTRVIQANTDFLVASKLAEAKAKATEVEAGAYAKALAIRTKAEQERVALLTHELKMSPVDIFSLDTQVKTAEAFAKTQGTLLLGGGNPSSIGLMSVRDKGAAEPLITGTQSLGWQPA